MILNENLFENYEEEWVEVASKDVMDSDGFYGKLKDTLEMKKMLRKKHRNGLIITMGLMMRMGKKNL